MLRAGRAGLRSVQHVSGAEASPKLVLLKSLAKYSLSTDFSTDLIAVRGTPGMPKPGKKNSAQDNVVVQAELKEALQSPAQHGPLQQPSLRGGKLHLHRATLAAQGRPSPCRYLRTIAADAYGKLTGRQFRGLPFPQRQVHRILPASIMAGITLPSTTPLPPCVC